jgi:hypothetical protein
MTGDSTGNHHPALGGVRVVAKQFLWYLLNHWCPAIRISTLTPHDTNFYYICVSISCMPTLEREAYYLWYADSSVTLPQERSLNVDFLKSERRRIEEAHDWDEEYRSADRGDKLPEYITYIIPIDVSKILKRRVNNRGYNIMGTSALRNSLQAEKLALFPDDMDLPADYSLIRIYEPKKEVVVFEGDTFGTDAIIVEDFEPLETDYIYQDMSSTRTNLLDLLKDYLGGDDLMAQSVHSPMISSPPAIQDTGGIGSASLTPNNDFANTLNEQVARMLPPEYTNYGPPSKDIQGYHERHSKGRGRKIVYKTAEKIPKSKSRVGITRGSSYRNVQEQAQTRATFSGEYSYLGNIVPNSKRKVDVVQDALNHFTQNEITISSYDELKQADVDLTRLKKDITDYEDIWIDIVDSRQVMPSIDRQQIDKERLVDKLIKDWEIFLPQMGYEDSPRQISELRAEQTYVNVLRLAQKIARSDKREQVTKDDIKNARRNFKHQAERLLASDVVKDATPEIKRNQTADRESIVHTFLQSKPCPKGELLSHLLDTRQFEKEGSTEQFIDRMVDRGYIYRTPDGRLHSV